MAVTTCVEIGSISSFTPDDDVHSFQGSCTRCLLCCVVGGYLVFGLGMMQILLVSDRPLLYILFCCGVVLVVMRTRARRRPRACVFVFFAI